MELKWNTPTDEYTPPTGSNRTFMELKYYVGTKEYCRKVF